MSSIQNEIKIMLLLDSGSALTCVSVAQDDVLISDRRTCIPVEV